MKEIRFSESQIVAILKEVELGAKVGETCRKHGVSKRRACSASRIARSTLRYRSPPRSDSGVIFSIQAHMALTPHHGFDLLYDNARHQKRPCGKTVLWRVYCQLMLNLSRTGKKRLPARFKQPLQAGNQPNQRWSCDFMFDAPWSVRRFGTFEVIDDDNWEGLRIEIDTSLPAARVIRALDELVEVRGAPLSIRLDNGPEFIAHALAEWAQSKGCALKRINRASPRRRLMSKDSPSSTEPRYRTATRLTAAGQADAQELAAPIQPPPAP